MRKVLCVMFCTLVMVGMTMGIASAEHYVSGVEGIKAASAPPPGFYWKIYNALYMSDTLMDDDGEEVDVGFDVTVFAQVHRIVWVTNYKFLGGDVIADILIPIIYTDLEIEAFGVEDDQFGLGDLIIEPFGIGWHGARYDAALAIAVFLPTGKYDVNEPASPGQDHWTYMLTYGGTVYFDEAKTWSASLLGRYEVHSENGDTDVTEGNDLHFEWGIGKTLAKFYDVGLAGYCQWQVTDDDPESVKDQVYAVGPQVTAFIPSVKVLLSAGVEMEFAAKNRSEGIIGTFCLTKIF